MKLKYYLDSKGKKVYTIKEHKNKELKNAHYKFIKLPSIKTK